MGNKLNPLFFEKFVKPVGDFLIGLGTRFFEAFENIQVEFDKLFGPDKTFAERFDGFLGLFKEGGIIALVVMAASLVISLLLIKDHIGGFAGIKDSVDFLWLNSSVYDGGTLEPITFGFGIYIDHVTVMLLFVASFLCLLINIFSIGYMNTDPINEDTISKLSSSIKIIANGAVGFGNIDIQAAKEKGITVTNTPDVLTDATADIQILLLLGASRKAYEGRIAAETQNWKWSWDFLLGKQMSNKRLGILGMGRIGRAVAKRAKAFGMEIHYHNRSKLSSDLEDGAIYHKDIKSLFEKSEFLSINCPATPETKNLINKETLSYLEENTVIGNAARGDVVDDDAMVEALKNGKVFAYGLDVYNGEPKIHPEYLKLKNIFLLPHLGSATKRTRWDMAYRATKNLEDFFWMEGLGPFVLGAYFITFAVLGINLLFPMIREKRLRFELRDKNNELRSNARFEE